MGKNPMHRGERNCPLKASLYRFLVSGQTESQNCKQFMSEAEKPLVR
jgi:hypothetical protein